MAPSYTVSVLWGIVPSMLASLTILMPLLFILTASNSQIYIAEPPEGISFVHAHLKEDDPSFSSDLLQIFQ